MPVIDAKRLKGLQLVVGVRIPEKGVARSKAIEVTYRIAGKQYRETFDSSIYVCAPGDEFPDCPPSDLMDVFDDRIVDWSAESS